MTQDRIKTHIGVHGKSNRYFVKESFTFGNLEFLVDDFVLRQPQTHYFSNNEVEYHTNYWYMARENGSIEPMMVDPSDTVKLHVELEKHSTFVQQEQRSYIKIKMILR